MFIHFRTDFQYQSDGQNSAWKVELTKGMKDNWGGQQGAGTLMLDLEPGKCKFMAQLLLVA
jgi:hypothetical protein